MRQVHFFVFWGAPIIKFIIQTDSKQTRTDQNHTTNKTLTFQTSALPNLHAGLARDVAHHKSRKTVQK